MNCMDYVKSCLKPTTMQKVENIILSSDFIRDKQLIPINSILVFTRGLHIGMGKLWGIELETDEMSEDMKLKRHLSLYDDNVKIVAIISEKDFKEGKVPEWQGI